VITDLHGVTGRDIMDHVIAGERDPKTLAQLARAGTRRKIAELEETLEGAEFFTAEHAALLTVMLERIDRVNAARSPTTSARSKPSASKSPSPASPNPTRTDQQAPRPPDPFACPRRRHKPPPAAAARPAEILFSG